MDNIERDIGAYAPLQLLNDVFIELRNLSFTLGTIHVESNTLFCVFETYVIKNLSGEVIVDTRFFPCESFEDTALVE